MTTNSKLTTPKASPSRVARAAVPYEWGPIHYQRKVGPGLFGFSCAGHGGLVAVLDSVEWRTDSVHGIGTDGKRGGFWSDRVDALSTTVHQGRFIDIHGRRRRFAPSSTHYVPEGWADHVHCVAIFEEDVDWAVACLAFVGEWTASAGYTTFPDQREADEHALQSMARWTDYERTTPSAYLRHGLPIPVEVNR